MKVLIVYDSVQGNTEKVAKAIAESLSPSEVKIVRPGEASGIDLKTFDVLLFGSPTMGGRPTQPMQTLLAGISPDAVKDKKFLAFDTRIPAAWVKIFGYASQKMAKTMSAYGAKPLALPEGFFVSGSKGPLKEGETERAAAWVKKALV
jgi:flavodoxin I